MGLHHLNSIFSPESVAIFGASEKTGSVGRALFQNILHSGFKGAIYPINPNHSEILGHKTYSCISEISQHIDLAVIITPALLVPVILEQCGKHNVNAAMIITAGFSETGETGKTLERTLLEIAQRYDIRLIGPNCLGIMRPDIGLNATFNKGNAIQGNLAFISQSGALCTAILDWAKTNDIGFSCVVSIGSSIDLDFGDIIDYLISDAKTHSILLYIEGIRNSRKFMSSVRAAARIKPVILIKAGRHTATSKAVLSHTASLVGSDDAFDAAVERAGAVRVHSIMQLFSVAKVLSNGFDSVGNRLAIVTNGGGPGIMATDMALDKGLEIAYLSHSTIESLNKVLPPAWSHNNPVDIIGDAKASLYQHAVKACLEDPNVDCVLTILTPQNMTKPMQVAKIIIEISDKYTKPLLSSWMGGQQVEKARNAFKRAKKLSFETPELAVEIFSFLFSYHKNQKLLMQIPGPLSHHAKPDIKGACMLIESALQEGRHILSEMESKAILAAFDIPVTQTLISHSPNEALQIAEQIGFPVAMKVCSSGITHKTDVNGVMLNLKSAEAVVRAYHEIIENVKLTKPDADIEGISVEPMIIKPHGRELMVGVANDPIFGPIITFGAGGTTVEVMNDRSVALPPLNDFLAKNLIQNTRAAKMLAAFRHMPPVHMEALEKILLRVSEMVCEIPMLLEMDINPLIVDENGALAADARVIVGFRQPSADRYSHMAIHPYPTYLISDWQLEDGTILIIRPIRPEDAMLELEFIKSLSEESRYFRFMESVKEPSESMLIRLTQIDYIREMAIIAIKEMPEKELGLGIARYAINPDGASCEFAIAVTDNIRGKGLGHKLMIRLMEIARSKGLKAIEGEVLKSNAPMLKLMKNLDFTIQSHPYDVNIKTVQKIL